MEKQDCKKVNIITPNMGGLDARHKLFNEWQSGQIQNRIAYLTTISGTHQGSPFADWSPDNLPYVNRKT